MIWIYILYAKKQAQGNEFDKPHVDDADVKTSPQQSTPTVVYDFDKNIEDTSINICLDVYAVYFVYTFVIFLDLIRIIHTLTVYLSK